MTAENNFINALQAYLDADFTDFDKKRVITFLEDYKQNLEPVIILKEKIVYKEVIVESFNHKPIVTQTDLEREALTICNQYEIPYDLFIKSKGRRSTNEIAEVRKAFCTHIMKKYKCSQERLRAFFNLNHASINYYLGGKKVRRLKTLKQTR